MSAEEIAKLEKRLANPSLPDSFKDKIRADLARLKGESAGEKPAKPVSKPSSSDSSEIEKLKRDIKDTSLPESLRQRLRTRLAQLQEEKPTPKKEVKKIKFKKPAIAKKKSETPKPAVVETEKEMRKRGRKPKEKPKEEEPKVVKKRGRKPKATAKPKVKKIYKPSKPVSKGEPDCDTLLAQWRDRRKKAKANAKTRKTKPVYRKIASDVIDAVEKAIRNVPSATIKESPQSTIRKFGQLKKSAEQFLKAFQDVLGSDYKKSEAETELNELKKLIDKLTKKYAKR